MVHQGQEEVKCQILIALNPVRFYTPLVPSSSQWFESVFSYTYYVLSFMREYLHI